MLRPGPLALALGKPLLPLARWVGGEGVKAMRGEGVATVRRLCASAVGVGGWVGGWVGGILEEAREKNREEPGQEETGVRSTERRAAGWIATGCIATRKTRTTLCFNTKARSK